MKNIQSDLNEQLLQQDFVYETEQLQLEQCQLIAQNFVELENGIAILSDLKNNKSYIYSGKIADELNIFQNRNQLEIESIWEDELFNILNPDDVLQKHILELQFFQFIKTVAFDKRKDFCIICKLRLLSNSRSLIHKMFYFSDVHHKNVELALCLYHFDFLPSSDYTGMIINTAEGSIIQQTEVENSNFLSAREKEILKMIQSGKKSKEIADVLFISINTVNRHRQNILEKMRVSNTTEACTLATRLKWI
ncbi:response regulator transcription factor [Epilithonimonas arachidiradicis]|uniref:Helix-turn-helix transcriptional regulator n=1 Tax=Epilithonimonas arachidiradicis TaxID=1617282 RepID=A0A420DBP3_9FLAO|nr:helix-turn-helix transcriptional regulator [Epilithonimonas arachidiradicis]RKE88976.1 regulatory LuxR family protein [Epilithonimonas arachidiradicis]GGG53555.1 helix-turn-helix transcriptional regulator [Epilithonimonas arachidiradicis]